MSRRRRHRHSYNPSNSSCSNVGSSSAAATSAAAAVAKETVAAASCSSCCRRFCYYPRCRRRGQRSHRHLNSRNSSSSQQQQEQQSWRLTVIVFVVMFEVSVNAIIVALVLDVLAICEIRHHRRRRSPCHRHHRRRRSRLSHRHHRRRLCSKGTRHRSQRPPPRWLPKPWSSALSCRSTTSKHGHLYKNIFTRPGGYPSSRTNLFQGVQILGSGSSWGPDACQYACLRHAGSIGRSARIQNGRSKMIPRSKNT